MSKAFVKKIHEQNKKVSASFPDKESTHGFVDQLFNFLFVPGSGRDHSLSEVEKEFDSLQSYMSTLVYDVTHDGERSQSVTEKFFATLPVRIPGPD